MVPVRFSRSEAFVSLVLRGDQIFLGSQKPMRKTTASWQSLPTCALARDGRLGVCVRDLGVNYYGNRVLEQKCVDHSVMSAAIFCVEHEEHGVGWEHNHLKTWLNWLCSVFQQELPLSRNQS